ncbi:MAG: hypothetical protein H7175_24720, partial [Burkholderiales bacterium]|nr:hypothetical protein [Anaerolineae bacterium]
PEHFEVAAWATFAPISAEIERYIASPLSGIQFGMLLGLPLTLLSGFGALSVWIPRLRPRRSWGLSFAIWMWFAAAAALALANPLPWQRYFLPFIPAAALLSGIGFTALLCVFGRYCSETRTPPANPLAS